MRLPALLKTLLLGITLIATPALAEDAVPLDANGRVPVGFKGDDAEKIFDAIAKLPNLYKDQFETEAEYQTRMKNFDRNAVTFEGGKNLGSRFAFLLKKNRAEQLIALIQKRSSMMRLAHRQCMLILMLSVAKA
ncbi:MAG: hypothetical protein AB1400_08810 [Pseudomonadota bacterium]